jgi:hypothetical protein
VDVQNLAGRIRRIVEPLDELLRRNRNRRFDGSGLTQVEEPMGKPGTFRSSTAKPLATLEDSKDEANDSE